MKHRRVLVLAMAVSAASLVVGCGGSSPSRARYTVEEYRQNAEARAEQVAKCSNDPGTFGQTPDCINAMQAESIEGLGTIEGRFSPRPSSPQQPGDASKPGQ